MGRGRLLALWLALCGLLLAQPALAGADPRALEQLGDEALAAGDLDAARGYYEGMLAAQEITHYLPYRPALGRALVLERLGALDKAAEQYRASITDDPLRTVQVLRILSRHPRRELLVQEAYAHVRAVVERALAGEDAVIYVTSKGADRYLEPVTLGEVLDNARAGKATKYCYLEALDLSRVEGPLPETIQLTRCVIGSIRVPDRDVGRLYVTGFILGDVDLGKTWEGEAHKSATSAASRFEEILFRDAIFLGRVNLSGVLVRGRRAYFPMAIFEGEADFKGAEFRGISEFRFASFGAGANFKDLSMHDAVYFGGTRFRDDVVFTQVSSREDVYFNSATFDGAATFERCEWDQSATFEDSRFRGPASFSSTRLRKRLNLSRTVFEDTLTVDAVKAEALDMFGGWLQGDASFVDSAFSGRVRFSPDTISWTRGQRDLDSLLPLYRDYQGDEDTDEPLATRSSYGVRSASDLITRIDSGVSFSNTVFGGITVFERVRFGRDGERGTASFFNTQFLGETHFEDTVWNAAADFTTIFGEEIAFNRARFRDTLILDDAYVKGRLALTDATFEEGASWSWYGAEIANFQVYPEHVQRADGPGHRLFYERCALGELDPADLRLQRLVASGTAGDEALRLACYDRVVDEFVGLKEHYADEAMTTDEDDAYWWERHHETMASLRFGSPADKLSALTQLLLFELCFGWGVRLGNLGVCTLVVTALFGVIYRIFCPDTVLVYDGEDILIRDVSYVGLFFVSLQSMLAINTGWDFGDDDHRFRYLNTLQTLIGVIILTFFVGAYTRMILA